MGLGGAGLGHNGQFLFFKANSLKSVVRETALAPQTEQQLK